jgi:WD40 repeat protein
MALAVKEDSPVFWFRDCLGWAAAFVLAMAQVSYAEPSAAAEKTPGKAPPARLDFYGDPLPPGARFRLGNVRLRSEGGIADLAWSPDGKNLAAAMGIVRIWRVSDGVELCKLSCEDHEARCVAYSPNGRVLATSHLKEGVCLWDAATGRRLHQLRDPSTGAWSIAFAPDSKTLAVGGMGRLVYIFDVDSGLDVQGFETGTEHCLSVAFSSDGKSLAAIDTAGAFFCWDTTSGKRIPKAIHAGCNGLLAFSPDGTRLAVLDSQSTVGLWRWPEGRLLHLLKADSAYCLGLMFTADSKTLTTAGQAEGIRQWDVKTGHEPRKPGSHRVMSVGEEDSGCVLRCPLAFSPGSARLASVDRDGTILLWDIQKTSEPPSVARPSQRMVALAATSDGKALVTVARDGSLAMYDVRTGQLLRPLEPWDHLACDITVSADGKILSAWDSETHVEQWDPSTGRRLAPLATLHPRTCAAAFSPDGRHLALGDWSRTVRVCEPTTGKELSRPAAADLTFRLNAPRGTPRLLLWSSDGRMLAVGHTFAQLGDQPGSHCLYDVEQGCRQVALQDSAVAPTALAFAPDGRWLASAVRDGDISLWEVVSGKRIQRIPSGGLTMNVLAFSSDGRTLACSARPESFNDHDCHIWLLDPTTGYLLCTLPGHRGLVHTLTFTANDSLLLSGSVDSTVLCWDVAAITGRPSSPSKELSKAELDTLWTRLASDNAVQGQRAAAELIRSPRCALVLLGKAVTPVTPVSADRLAELIAELDHEDFSHRERATRELEDIGEQAVPALRRALKGKPPLEARRRLERLLETIDGLAASPEWIRTVRALQVLESIGSPEARQLLERLAGGAPEARLTREAKIAVQRLARRAPLAP